MTFTDALTLINAIKNHGYKPNPWEQGFIQSVLAMKPGTLLTYKQTRALETIYSKSAGQGLFQGRQRI